MCIAESLCCTTGINNSVINYTSIKRKIKNEIKKKKNQEQHSALELGQVMKIQPV